MNVFYKWSCYNDVSQFYSGGAVSKSAKKLNIEQNNVTPKTEELNSNITDLPHNMN